MVHELLDTERLTQRGKKGYFYLNTPLKIPNKRQLFLLAGISSWCWIGATGGSKAATFITQNWLSSSFPILKTLPDIWNFPVHSEGGQEAAKMTAEQKRLKFWMEARSSQKTDLLFRSSKADYRTTSSKQFLRGTWIPSEIWRRKKKKIRILEDKENNPVSVSDIFRFFSLDWANTHRLCLLWRAREDSNKIMYSRNITWDVFSLHDFTFSKASEKKKPN